MVITQAIFGPAKKIQPCENCEAILVYDVRDVFDGKYVYCPNCKKKMISLFDLEWNGVVKNGSQSSEERK